MEFPGSLNRWDRYHIIPQLAVYTTYIPLIYCRPWVIIYHRSPLLREQSKQLLTEVLSQVGKNTVKRPSFSTKVLWDCWWKNSKNHLTCMKHDETLQKLGIFTISTGAGFQDVFHQQYAGMTKIRSQKHGVSSMRNNTGLNSQSVVDTKFLLGPAPVFVKKRSQVIIITWPKTSYQWINVTRNKFEMREMTTFSIERVGALGSKMENNKFYRFTLPKTNV